MNDPSQMMNGTYGIWKAPAFPLTGYRAGRMNWKGKKAAGKRKMPGGGGGGSGYKPPALSDLQYQNRVKARRFYPKKKYTRFVPLAPRNTTSFIIRAKKFGGIASLVSPCPVTPAILPTPRFSPSRERLADMAEEEWGVDGYGSMKGLIRLRSPTAGRRGVPEEDDYAEDGSSESDLEEHLDVVERRLDHDLSRFEIVYPSPKGEALLLENRVDDHIARLEEENLTLRERLFLMEGQMGELRRRLQLLETDYRSCHGNNSSSKEAPLDNDGGSEKSVGDCEGSSGNHAKD